MSSGASPSSTRLIRRSQVQPGRGAGSRSELTLIGLPFKGQAHAVTLKSVAELGLVPGGSVYALIKSASLEGGVRP